MYLFVDLSKFTYNKKKKKKLNRVITLVYNQVYYQILSKI